MSETLTTKFTGQLNATLQETLPLSQANDSFRLDCSAALTNGTNASQADELYGDTRTVIASGTDTVSMYDFTDGTNTPTDPLGNPLTMARVKMIFIQNLNGTESNSITAGPAASQGWTAPFNGASSAKVLVPGGSSLGLIAPGQTGFVVSNGTNHKLAIVNTGTTAIDYNLVVIGASA